MPRPKKTTPETHAPAEAKPSPSASTPPSLSGTIRTVCDILRRSNCTSALQYVPELTWILFLRILDAQENRARTEAEASGSDFAPSLHAPFRWQDWAAPTPPNAESVGQTPEGQPVGWKRKALGEQRIGALIEFVNKELLPHLHRLATLSDGRPNPAATPKQRVIGRLMTAVERVRVDTEGDFTDILDRLDAIDVEQLDATHTFTLSQVYEDLLLKMGEKNSDGGQFFTPREVVRAVVATLNPTFGETVYDPCCGTGGFLAQSFEWMKARMGDEALSTDLERLRHETFFGREKENLVFPIALANLVLHGIDQPNLWHGNALTKRATYDGLFRQAPGQFDVILTNPPFGGKEGKDAQKQFAFETSATQVLFVQGILSELADGGSCGIVLDEGLLFRTNESAFVETKRKLLDECDLWAIVSLPGGVFSTAGAGVKTNLLFFTKGRNTERIWYYDLSWVKVGKKTPLTLAHFGFGKDGAVLDDAALPAALVADWTSDEASAGQAFPSYARTLAKRGDSRYSWTVDFAARRARARDEMQPLLDQATTLKAELVDLKEDLKRLRKAKADAAKLDALESKIREMDKAARDLEAEASVIDAAVFDLKAVNPNAVVVVDERTPAELIASIDAQGRITADALARLSRLLVQP